MKTLVVLGSLFFLGSITATASPQAPLGRIRGFGQRTVLVETANGRMVTVDRSVLSRKSPWKMGGWVSLKGSSRSARKS